MMVRFTLALLCSVAASAAVVHAIAADGVSEERATTVSDADVAAVTEQWRQLVAARGEATGWLLEHAESGTFE